MASVAVDLIVNNHRINVPSYTVKVGDVISVREGSKTSPLFEGLSEHMKKTKLPAWLSWDIQTNAAKINGQPLDPEQFLNFQAVIEFYTR